MGLLSRPRMWRLLGVAALALGLVLLASGGFAAEDTVAMAKKYAFPYFGPDPSAAAMIHGAFIAQSNLLGSYAGGDTPIHSMALFAALIGALFLVFRPGLWRMEVLAPWFVILVVLIFTPINSRLLLQEVKKPETVMNFFRYAEGGKDLSAKSQYGFAPQVAAIDVASRAQVMVSNMFRSVGWRNLLETTLAEQKLMSSPKLNAGGPWLVDLTRYVKGESGCSMDLSSMASEAKALRGDKAADISKPEVLGQKPTTLEEKWAALREYFTAETYKDSPPLLVILPETNLPEAFDTNYLNAIDRLYSETVPRRSVENLKKGNVANAFDEMGFFFRTAVIDKAYTNLVGPGYFITRGKYYDESSKGTQEGAENGGYTNPLWARTCYGFVEVRKREGGGPWANNQICGGAKKNTVLNPDWARQTFMKVDDVITGRSNADAGFLGRDWNAFIKAWPEIKNMPILWEQPIVVRDKAGNTTVSTVQATGAMTGSNCAVNGIRLVNRALTEFGSKNPDLKSFTGFLCQIGDKGQIDCASAGLTAPDQFDLKRDITSKDLNRPDAEFAKSLLDYFNGLLRDYDGPRRARYAKIGTGDEGDTNPGFSGDVGEERRLFLLSNMMRLMVNVTGQLVSKDAKASEAEKAAVEDSRNIGISGLSGITSLGGSLSYIFGQVLLTVGAFFTGPLAQAFVAFITLLVQMSLMALIVLTPFLFLAGLLMPGAALGVMTIAVVAAFVLQFVPVTMIILNYLGGFIYETVGALAGPSAWTMQNMIIIGMSGLYTTVVGLTFYLIFKMGDPAAFLGRIAALDGAAKDAAARGFAVTASVAAAAAMFASGTLSAGAGYLGLVNRFRKEDKDVDPQKDGQNNAETGHSGPVDDINKMPPSPGEDPNAPGGGDDVPPWLGGSGGLNLGGLSGLSGLTPDEAVDEQDKAVLDAAKPVDASLNAERDNAAWVRGKLETDTRANITKDSTDKLNLPDRNAAGGAAIDREPGAGAGAAQQGAQREDVTEQEKIGTAKVAREMSKDQISRARRGVAMMGSDGQPVPSEKYESKRRAETDEKANRIRSKIDELKMEPEKNKFAIQAAEKVLADLYQADFIAELSGESLVALDAKDGKDLAKKLRGAADDFGKKFKWSDLAKSMESGARGSFSAIGGGLGGIPIIGNVLRESLNEYMQAPERVRAWKAVGGAAIHRQMKRDAERGAFYKQEISPVAAGDEYADMLADGGFQAQINLSRQAARESLTRSRSSYEALTLKARDEKSKGGDIFTTREMAGLGRYDAAKRINTVVNEATQMQIGKLEVKLAGGEKGFVNYSHRVLDDIASGLALKDFNKIIDSSMLTHYGVQEKALARESAGWKAARDYRTDREARARFLTEDLGTDYLTGGHLKMIEGKAQFFDMRGKYEALTEARNKEGMQIDQFIKDNLDNPVFQQAMAEAGKGLDTRNAQLKAAASLIDKRDLPLTSWVESKRSQSYYKYKGEVRKAVLAQSRAEEDMMDGIIDDVLKTAISRTGMAAGIQNLQIRDRDTHAIRANLPSTMKQVCYKLAEDMKKNGLQDDAVMGELLKLGEIFTKAYNDNPDRKGEAFEFTPDRENHAIKVSMQKDMIEMMSGMTSGILKDTLARAAEGKIKGFKVEDGRLVVVDEKV